MQHSTESSLQFGKDRVQHHQIIHRIEQLDNHFISTHRMVFLFLPEDMDRRVHHDRFIRVNDLSLVLHLSSSANQHLVVAIVQTLHDETSAPSGRRKRGERRVHLVHQHHNAARIRDCDVVIKNLMSIRVIQHRFADLRITIRTEANQLRDHHEQVRVDFLLQQHILLDDVLRRLAFRVLQIHVLAVVQLFEQQETLPSRQDMLVQVFNHMLQVNEAENAHGGHLVSAHRLQLAVDRL